VVDGHGPDATILLDGANRGDRASADRLLALVYDELRERAANYLRRESPGHTLQPTALVHEAYVKLVDQSRVNWKGRTHFLAVAANSMRRILVDHARGQASAKRGGDRHRLSLSCVIEGFMESELDPLALDEALQKLTAVDERASRIVELRFFSELTEREAAQVLGVSERTVRNDWAWARQWLRRELGRGTDDGC